ncbi:hypothetical protein MUP07_00750 [Candidatus Bathyarchaeota archaeon]|nr:hypothetical protein [Candidatus Bathyarchaeota archaeon]
MEEPKKVTLLLNHPASDEMALHVNKSKHHHSSSWPIDTIRKLGWEDKDDAILCIHYCYDGDGKDPVGVVIELSPNQPKPAAPPPETKSPPPEGTKEALKSLKLCEACGQQNEQANLHCIHCGAPFPNLPPLSPVSTAPAA